MIWVDRISRQQSKCYYNHITFSFGNLVTIDRRHPPMLAIGSDDPNPSAGGKVQIYEYSDSVR